MAYEDDIAAKTKFLDLQWKFLHGMVPPVMVERAKNIWMATDTFKKEQQAIQEKTDAISSLKSQVLDQWKQLGVPSIGGGLSIDERAQGLAERLYANQITDLAKLGLGTGTQLESAGYVGDFEVQKEVPVSYLTYDGRQIGFLGDIGTAENWQPTGYLQQGNLASWGAQGEGAVSYTVQQAPNGQYYFAPSWGSTSDWGAITPITSILSVIPSPLQPFAAAVNAAVAFDQGNVLGGVLGTLGAAYSFGNQFGTIDPSSANAVNGMDLASDIASGATSATTEAANLFAQNAANIKTASQAVGLLNALDKQNLAGVINGVVSLSSDISIPREVTKAMALASAAAAINKGDYIGAAAAAGVLADKPHITQDAKLVAQAKRLVDALKTDNPQAMMTSFVSFAQDAGLGSSVVKDAAKQVGAPMSDKAAANIYESTDPDAQVKEYYNVLNQVKDSYKKNFGEDPSLDTLSSFAENGGLLNGYNSYVTNMNTTTGSEIEDMLKKAGLTTKDLNPDQVIQALALPENSASNYINQLVDMRKNSFDGSKLGSTEAAAAAAIKAGQNTFIAPDGNTYNVVPGDVAKQVVIDSKAGKNVGVDPNSFKALNGDDFAAYMTSGDIPEIVITASKLSKPSPADAEAWAAYQKELKDLGGASFPKFFRDQLDILTEAFKGTKPDTFANAMKNALAFGARNFGSLSSNLLRGAEAVGLDANNAALRTSQALERWGKINQSKGIIDAEGQFNDAINGVTKASLAAQLKTTPDKISDTQVAVEQLKELGRQMVNNPLGTFSVGLGEAAQEVPFLVASGGTGAIASKMLGKVAGFAVARGTDAALNGFESFSGNYAEVKDYLTKNGYSSSKAEAKAVASGLEAMGVTMLTSWVGDKAIIKSFMGDVASSSVANIVGAGAKEYVMGYVEGGLQNASAQIAKYGSVQNMAEVTAAGTIEGFVQAGLTSGTLTSSKLAQVVAKDYQGNNVTLGSIVNGTSTFDPSTLNKSVELSTGFNLGDAVAYSKTFSQDPNITPTEYMKTAEFFRSEGLEPTVDNIAKVVGGETDLTGTDLQKAATTYADQNYVTSAEAKQMLADLGYQNPTQAQIDQFVGNKVEDTVKTDASNWVNQNTVTRDEAIQTLKDLGYANPTDTLINKLVGQYDQSQLKTKAEDLGIATKQDILDAIANINLPTGLTKDDVAASISAYMAANPGISAADVTKSITDYMTENPGLTAADVSKAIAAATKGMATDAELAQTEKDILAEVAKNEKAGMARDAALQKAINTVAATQKTDTATLTSKLSALGTNLGKEIDTLQADLAQTEKDILAEVAANEKAGMTRDAALQKAINTVAAAQKTDTATLTKSVGALGTALGKEIDAVQADLAQTEKDILAEVAKNEKAGMTRDAALQKAINTVAATQKKDVASILTKLGTTAEGLDTKIAGVQAELAQTEKDILAQVALNEKAGMTRDAALQKAINTVAAAQKTDTATLTSKISGLGTTLSKEIDAVQADLAQTEKDILAEVAANEKAGMSRDAALQKAIDTVAATQKTDKAALLTKLGTTEANLKTAFTTQISGLNTKLTKAIADAKAAGLKGDAALQSAIDAVAGDLGTTKTDLLNQLGTTEAALKEQISGVSADVQAKYDALTADQKVLADTLRQQGVDLNTAIDTAKAQTQQQITELSADVQAKYDALTAEQKATADALAKQGVDLNAAIEQAKTSITADVQAKYDSLTASQKSLADSLAQQGVDLKSAIDIASKQAQQQVADLGESLNQRVDQLMKQGLDQYTATQQAISEVTQQNQQLQTQIGTQAKTATQQDIDALTQMLGGQRSVDLAYDVTGDKQITQADIDFLSQVVSGQKQGWTAPAGSPWAATGLYGQIAASEAQRQADLQAQELQRQNDIKAQIARENEAARQSAIRTTAGQAAGQVQSLINQLPQAAKAAQTTTTPIYAGEMTPFDLGSPLDVGFFSPSKEKQTSQPGQQTTKIASGGYLDDLLDLLR